MKCIHATRAPLSAWPIDMRAPATSDLGQWYRNRESCFIGRYNNFFHITFFYILRKIKKKNFVVKLHSRIQNGISKKTYLTVNNTF